MKPCREELYKAAWDTKREATMLVADAQAKAAAMLSKLEMELVLK